MTYTYLFMKNDKKKKKKRFSCFVLLKISECFLYFFLPVITGNTFLIIIGRWEIILTISWFGELIIPVTPN